MSRHERPPLPACPAWCVEDVEVDDQLESYRCHRREWRLPGTGDGDVLIELERFDYADVGVGPVEVRLSAGRGGIHPDNPLTVTDAENLAGLLQALVVEAGERR